MEYGGSLIQYDCVFTKRGNLDTETLTHSNQVGSWDTGWGSAQQDAPVDRVE